MPAHCLHRTTGIMWEMSVFSLGDIHCQDARLVNTCSHTLGAHLSFSVRRVSSWRQCALSYFYINIVMFSVHPFTAHQPTHAHTYVCVCIQCQCMLCLMFIWLWSRLSRARVVALQLAAVVVAVVDVVIASTSTPNVCSSEETRRRCAERIKDNFRFFLWCARVRPSSSGRTWLASRMPLLRRDGAHIRACVWCVLRLGVDGGRDSADISSL